MESPSQRFRFEQYFPLLSESGIEFEVQSFLSSHSWQLFFMGGRPLSKLLALMKGFFRRIKALTKMSQYDYVFIHREAAPVGPPLFEWIIGRILAKKIIYDFDDAIWATDKSTETWWIKLIKWRSKVRAICRWSYKVSCGNEYLTDFAKKYNNNVVLNPTTIDTLNRHDPSRKKQNRSQKEGVVIGWTGSHSTLKYLINLAEVLKGIESRFPNVQIAVIADRNPELRLNNFHFIPWKEETEIDDLMEFDIGIMPLPDEVWTRGKCGFKALQYLALKIPAVCSPVGVNKKIIENGRNGFLCSTNDEWESALTTLINNIQLRHKMGEHGRIKVIDSYSVLSNSTNFLALFA